MTRVELKARILKELENADDPLLEEILGIIGVETNREELVKIPDHFKEALDNSISQMNSGKTVPNREVEESIEKWLYK